MNKSRFIVPTRPIKKSLDDVITVVLLCGAMGYRMKSYGPRCLIPYEGKTFNIKCVFPNSDIIITTGFESDKITKKTNLRIVENQLHETTNTMEEVRLAFNNCMTDNIVFINGNMVIQEGSLQGITNRGSSVLVEDDVSNNEVGVTITDSYIQGFAYALKPKWKDIVYLEDREFKSLKKISSDRDINKWFLWEGLDKMLSKKCRLQPVHNQKEIIKIERSKDIANL